MMARGGRFHIELNIALGIASDDETFLSEWKDAALLKAHFDSDLRHKF